MHQTNCNRPTFIPDCAPESMYIMPKCGPTDAYHVYAYDVLNPGLEIGFLNPYKTECPEIASFRDYLDEHITWWVYDALRGQIETGTLKVGKTTAKVPRPAYARLQSAFIACQEVVWDHDDVFFVDVIIRADIGIASLIQGKWEENLVEQWYRVPMKYEFFPEIQMLETGAISIYSRQDKKKGLELSAYLVPRFDAAQMDLAAEAILKRYYPEALEQPTSISAKELARRMGFGIQYECLTDNRSVMGQLFYDAGTVQVYDPEAKSYREINVAPRTILIDRDAVERNYGNQYERTLLHECVHIALHRWFYQLQKLYNEDMQSLSCPVAEPTEEERTQSPLVQIERQANQLIPRLHMPASITKTKIEALLKRYGPHASGHNRPRVLERVIAELATMFQVSKQTARLRMIELGYEEAHGVLNYVNGGYAPGHSFAPGSLKKNQTFTISFENAVEEYSRNPELQKLLDAGNYLYLEGHFCLNTARYVKPDRAGNAQMAGYARQHMDECCLVFDIKSHGKAPTYRMGTLQRETASLNPQFELSGKTNLDVQASAALAANAKKVSQIMLNLPASFTDTLVENMRRQGVTIEMLEERTQISARTLSRIRNEIDYPLTIKQLIAVCIGLHLEPELSMDLIGKSGVGFKGSPEHMMYRMMVRSMYNSTVAQCNACLQMAGYDPLTCAI